ncbi:hypothetical protein ARAM_006064, partial [Aspergillus rambellii]
MTKDSFSAAPQILEVDAILSDFDGTIVDSTEVTSLQSANHDIYSARLAAEFGVDPNVILATSHGRRSIDMIKLYDPKKANWEFRLRCRRNPRRARPSFRARCEQGHLGRCDLRTRALVNGWLGVLDLISPKMLVVAEDVEAGKPDPSCYLLGRKRLGLEHSADIVVFEDAPSGIRAGKAAGFKVLALTTTHTLAQVLEAGADWVVEDLRSVS